MERAVLANRLFVPDHWLAPEDLEPWSYYWTERCYEEEADLDGNIIFNEYGKAKLKFWDEDRELKTYRNIRTAGVTQYVSVPRGNLAKVRGLVRNFNAVDIRSVPPLGFKLELDHTVLEDHRWPDQERCVTEWMKKGYGVVKGDTGSGKGLVHGEPVVTDQGYVPIEKIQVGILVASTDGKFYPVEGVFPQGEKDIYRMNFSDGSHVDCDGDHLWTFDLAHGYSEQLTLNTFTVYLNPNCLPHRRRFNLPIPKPIESLKYLFQGQNFERHVESVEPIGRGPATCISVASPNRLFLTRNCIPTHNTIIGIGITAKLGLRTLLLSTLRDGREQWEDEIRSKTNIGLMEKRLRRRLIGPLKRGKEPFAISMATLQTFLEEVGRQDLVRLQDEFGLVLVDECHSAATPEYSRIVMSFNPFSFVGLTATEKREDRGHLLMFDMLGPVVTEGTARQMPPKVFFISTGINQPKWLTKKKFSPRFKWRKILEHIEKSEDRYKVMMTYLHKDLDDGRIIAIVSQRRKIVQELYQRLRQDGYKVAYVDGNTRNRKTIYQSLFEGKIQCLCAGKVLNQLVNLPTVDCLHFVTPVASELATKQAYGRARRWLEGKREPIIRDYVDSGGQLTGAFKKRMKLCEANGWKTRIVDEDESRLARLSPWLKRRKKKR
jgi:superfamily II DNA or RNA helicase